MYNILWNIERHYLYWFNRTEIRKRDFFSHDVYALYREMWKCYYIITGIEHLCLYSTVSFLFPYMYIMRETDRCGIIIYYDIPVINRIIKMKSQIIQEKHFFCKYNIYNIYKISVNTEIIYEAFKIIDNLSAV